MCKRIVLKILLIAQTTNYHTKASLETEANEAYGLAMDSIVAAYSGHVGLLTIASKQH